MTPRAGLAVALAGPLAAAAGGLAYLLFGHGLVEAAYEQRLPLEPLNRIITGQAVHPVAYHLQRADALAWRLAILLVAWGPLAGAGLLYLRRRPDSPWNRPLVAAVALATASLWGLLLLEAPLLQVLPGWFWPLRRTSLPAAWIALPLAAGSWLVVRQVLRQADRTPRNLLLLVLWGACLQHGFATMEGRGLDTLRSRFTDTGHGVFARAAVEQDDLWRIASGYEALLGELEGEGYFHATRPPGLQVLVAALERISAVLPLPGDRLQRLATLAALVLPCLGYAAVVPLFALARRLAGPATAWAACLLYVAIPSGALMPMHADHYLHPLLGLTFLYLTVRALTGPGTGAPWALLAGAAFYVALWFSFALLALLAVPPALAWGLRAVHPPRRLARTAGLAAAGFAAMYALFAVGLDYDALHRMTQALAAHGAAKGVDWGLGKRLYFAGLNMLELAVWCGPPVAILCGAELAQAARRLRAGGIAPSVTGADGPGLGLLGALAGLALLGTTAAESARLWIFLVPLVVVCSARQLQRLPEAIRSRALAGVLTLQVVTILVLKRYQDFH